MIIDRFIPKINEMISDRVDTLSTGRCENFQQYTHACGEILGLRKALEEFLSLKRQADDDDDAGDASA